MFNFRHPRPVVDGRAVAVQVVQQQKAARPQVTVLVAEQAKTQAQSQQAQSQQAQTQAPAAEGAPAASQ